MSTPPGRASSTRPASRTTGAIIAAIWSASASRRPGPAAIRSTGLRHDSDLEIETGMSFHILSWLMGTGRGDDFISNTVLLTDTGAGSADAHADRPDHPLAPWPDTRHFRFSAMRCPARSTGSVPGARPSRSLPMMSSLSAAADTGSPPHSTSPRITVSVTSRCWKRAMSAAAMSAATPPSSARTICSTATPSSMNSR